MHSTGRSTGGCDPLRGKVGTGLFEGAPAIWPGVVAKWRSTAYLTRLNRGSIGANAVIGWIKNLFLSVKGPLRSESKTAFVIRPSKACARHGRRRVKKGNAPLSTAKSNQPHRKEAPALTVAGIAITIGPWDAPKRETHHEGSVASSTRRRGSFCYPGSSAPAKPTALAAGIDGACLYTRKPAAAWVGRHPSAVKHKGKSSSTSTLGRKRPVALSQMGTIEIHPWVCHRRSRHARPLISTGPAPDVPSTRLSWLRRLAPTPSAPASTGLKSAAAKDARDRALEGQRRMADVKRFAACRETW